MRINIYSKAVLLLCLGLASPALFSQEAYKWVDEQGNVHYGDKPPETVTDPVPVAIEPGPTEEQKQAAEELQEKRLESAESLETNREAREAEEAKRLAEEKKADESKPEQKAEDENTGEQIDNNDDVITGTCRDAQGHSIPCRTRAPITKLPRPAHPIVNPRPSPR